MRYTASHNITPLVIGLWTLRFYERIAQGLCLYLSVCACHYSIISQGDCQAFLRTLSKKFCAKLRISAITSGHSRTKDVLLSNCHNCITHRPLYMLCYGFAISDKKRLLYNCRYTALPIDFCFSLLNSISLRFLFFKSREQRGQFSQSVLCFNLFFNSPFSRVAF